MDIKEIYNLNQKYEQNDCNGIYQGINNLKIIEGNVPILLSAPHSVKHVRNGLFKRSDGLTGGMVEYLCLNNGTFGITRVHNMLDDPNYYNVGQNFLYKKVIIDLINKYGIKYFLDIHGCNNNHSFDVDIGTNNGLNVNDLKEVEIFADYLSSLGTVTIDNKFKASKYENISRYIHEKTGISCLQLELSEKVRFEKTGKLIISLGKIINELKKIAEDIEEIDKYSYKKTKK